MSPVMTGCWRNQAGRASPPMPGSRRPGSRRNMFRALLLGLLIFAPAAADGACENGCERRFPPDSGIVNVRDFGAVVDGQADDTAALRAAIDAAGPNSGP